jgi:hypothetical protein
MAHILYSYVGELASFHGAQVTNTPDGMRYCRRILVDALTRKGHKVTAVQKRVENTPYRSVEYVSSGFPQNVDIVFCEWRWKTYHGESPDLKRQHEILQRYHGNTPIILFDAAFQITGQDELKWPLAIIADPSIQPRHLARSRERMFFWTDFKELLPCKDPLDLQSYTYVGNEYDRPEVFKKFYTDAAFGLRNIGVQTCVYGNWIDRSAARPNPGETIKKTHDVMFAGRFSYHDSMIYQNKSIATTHLMKPEYDKQGNITVRFSDCLATNTPALVPESFRDPNILGDFWKVRDADQVISRVQILKNMSIEQRKEVIEEQKATLQSRYDIHVDRVVEFIESKLPSQLNLL